MEKNMLVGKGCAKLPIAAIAAVISTAAYCMGAQPHDAIVKSAFGANPKVDAYTLKNSHGIEVRIMTYGATITSLKTPDRDGKLADIVLGFDALEPYLKGVPYFGATVGRYANRIAGGNFVLNGKTYQLPKNDGTNSLHGGVRGFDKRVWTAAPQDIAHGTRLRLTYVSADGEEGYPGTLTAHVVYTLDDEDRLTIEYSATTTAPTPVNLANHAYFNLTGDPKNTILHHVLTLDADRFTPVDKTLIPTGELRSVAGTPFDFRKPETIGSRIDADDEQLHLAHGYDHNWVLDKPSANALSLAAVLTDPASGRSLELFTTQPGLQFYSGNFLDGKPAGQGSVFPYRTGLCLETQHFPDSPNHDSFPSTILKPGQTYYEKTVLAFRTIK